MPFKKGLLVRSPFPVTFTQMVAAGSLLTTNALFVNPSTYGEYYDVLSADASWDVVSNSGTVDIRRVPASTAFTGGNSLLNATINTAIGARTANKVTLAAAAASRQIRPGDSISLILGGTQTGLVAFSITLWLQSMRGKRAR